MKDQPWDRGAYKRFGLTMFGRTAGRPEAGLGWAVLAMTPKTSEVGEMLTEDPFAAAIAMAQQAMAAGADGVDLYRFRNAEVYRRSRDAAEGGTFAEHNGRIEMLAQALRELRIPVNILIVEE